ncbi:hypothetical protein GCM10011613_19930 [Cellvibrio zantedeschiae]|uniref:DUF3300 domain-containing protein n=1 Tax=Cellvibrio zantedeschiae TaxID=1237077 RepID=A0ABQ3B4N2_9GAMM|nr:DUF3300 domain-containing protein [Cellvibrio zantedeschiae]GGY74503.1 hypothetical protein GCM10011613_19930 [Cellvibrio zantedeschiae]
MKFPMSLAKSLHKAVLALLTVIPLLMMAPVSQAANQEDVEFSQAELDQMLAPIALYPDALLSQVLIAATYPLEIIQADRWVRSNKDLKTEDALKFAQNKDWDPSVKALVAFPDILKRMSEDVDWTQRLGDAFLSDEEAVMDAVQRLRKRAYATGNLEKAQHITVERDDNNIIIEPAEERIVYVPVYDTRVVYGNWWWPDYPPVFWHYPSSYTYVSGFYWGTSIYLGPTYFYSSCRWRDRRVVVVDHHHHYDGHTRFYTGRSIVGHSSARLWRHEPAHRHGVAYYNNNLRETYGSRRQSYQNDRDYRQQHRDNSVNQNPRISDGWKRDNDRRDDDNRWDNNGNHDRNNRNENRNPNGHYDRADQVRERLNRDSNDRDNNINNRPLRGNTDARGVRVQNQAQQQVTTENNISPSFNRTEENGRNRGNVEQGRQSERGIDVNNNNRLNIDQERRIVTDDADRRPNFSGPVQRAQEQRISEPQPRVERQMERQEVRRAEFSPPRNDNEGRGQPQQRAERAHNNPRFSRDKNDDNK